MRFVSDGVCFLVGAAHVCAVASACHDAENGSTTRPSASKANAGAGGNRGGQRSGTAGFASAIPGLGSGDAMGSVGRGAAAGGSGDQQAAGAAGISGEVQAAGAAGISGEVQAAGAAGTSGEEHAASAGGKSGLAACTTPPPPLGKPTGWAAMPGYDVATTTGGGDAVPVVVTNFAALSAAAAGTKPAVIHVQGNIAGSLSVGSNKTIVGICGGKITGTLHLSSSSNVIIRNLKVVGSNCSDSPTNCSGGADAVTIINGAHHIWVDHCDISDGSDGNLDITNGSDLVTVSYTKFSYSQRREGGHQFSNLIGSADDIAADVGRLNVTFHHDWWAENVEQRMPRTRRGKVHLFNNLFTATGNSYCTNAGFEAAVRVENNIYVGVNEPLAPDANAIGLESIGNLFIGTSGNLEGLRSSFEPPYPYELDATEDLRRKLEVEVGPKYGGSGQNVDKER